MRLKGREGRRSQKRCLPLLSLTFIADFFSHCTLLSRCHCKYRNNNNSKKKTPSKTQTSSKASQNEQKITPSLPTMRQRFWCCSSARFSCEGKWIQWFSTVRIVLWLLLLEIKNMAWLFSSCCWILSCQPSSVHSAQVSSEAQNVTAKWWSIHNTTHAWTKEHLSQQMRRVSIWPSLHWFCRSIASCGGTSCSYGELRIRSDTSV